MKLPKGEKPKSSGPEVEKFLIIAILSNLPPDKFKAVLLSLLLQNKTTICKLESRPVYI